jgi:hypothetical protein
MTEIGWEKFKIDLADDAGNSLLYVVDDLRPFIPEIKRVYFTRALEQGVVRGHHAHKMLKQVIIVITGSYNFELENQFGIRNAVPLYPGEGLFIHKPVWRVYTSIEPNSSFVTLCSCHYDERDYIRDHQDFVTGEF